MVMLHGCTVGEGSLIGIGAVILNGAKIGKGCLIGAKSLIAENKEIPDYSLVMGVPGKVVRTFTPEEAQMMLKNAVSYQNNWKRFSQGLKKRGDYSSPLPIFLTKSVPKFFWQVGLVCDLGLKKQSRRQQRCFGR